MATACVATEAMVRAPRQRCVEPAAATVAATVAANATATATATRRGDL